MAVFMINICKFNGCGITFPSLGDLIQHIEDTHIDYDPLVIEKKEAAQPASLPLSYVLKFFTEATRREHQTLTQLSNKRSLLTNPVPTKPPSVRSSTPTGSEYDDEELASQSEDSNDSWTTVEEYSSEFILRYGSRLKNNSSYQNQAAVEKPFACPVPGCKKRYKNINGIKYHSKNGHKKDGKVRKGYKCHCGKSYKTAQGLKAHSIHTHFSNNQSPLFTNTSQLSPTNIYNNNKLQLVTKKLNNVLVTSGKELQSRTVSVEPGDGKLLRILEGSKTKDGHVNQLAYPKHNYSELKIITSKSEYDINANQKSTCNNQNYSPVSQLDRFRCNDDDRLARLIKTSNIPVAYTIDTNGSYSTPVHSYID